MLTRTSLALAYSTLSFSFFTRFDHHPALHSFPTRRSSDLSGTPSRAWPAISTPPPGRARPAPRRDHRSEEHTSELQSHLNLVCRLLLEKKNILQDQFIQPQFTV